MSNLLPSSSTSNANADSAGGPTTSSSASASLLAGVSPKPRRTLQSGFSLLARGEPKIWLTGGMLVICITMIVGLLGLILVNGLATFWPGPVDWLVLDDGTMDIGEPQRRELRVASSTPGSELGQQSDPTLLAQKASSGASRFYRTANFDITNRHYRWFEPEEIQPGGIVRPEWALVIERLSWGRMYALPSQLSLPLRDDEAEVSASGTGLGQWHSAQALFQELSSELESLSAQEPAVPLNEIQTWLDGKVAELRSVRLRSNLSSALAQTGGLVQWKTEEGGNWQSSRDGAVPSAGDIWSARRVWNEPAEILQHIEPVLTELAGLREQVDDAMHEISLLDTELSDARVSVRQAELDTGRSVLDKVDAAGPIIESLAGSAQTLARVERALALAAADADDSSTATRWRQLWTRYRDQVLIPARDALQAELIAWRDQFAQEPALIQSSIDRFAQVWRTVIDRKRPLEEAIQLAEQRRADHDLSVQIPSDATSLEIDASDTQQLLDGRLTEAARAALAAQSIVPDTTPPQAQRLSDEVATVEVIDEQRGRITLWCRLPSGTQPIWLVPQQRSVPCAEIVRLFPANRLGVLGKSGIYLARWREFLLEDPREANTEGGVFPAIWGTVVMTLIMTLAVVPFGVIAALYLREYTRSGPLVSLVRISINNLAGVPSIVYGVFGLAFFCYSIGAFVDGGARNAQFGTLPDNNWYGLLAGTVALGVVAFLFSLLGSGTDRASSRWKRGFTRAAPWLWLLSLVGAGVLVFKSPFFDGFFEARLPAPTFGKEGLLWASLTLALLTLPVVIVATEEALSAVPNSLREGSLACGASKWQTIYRIVLPHARPGILTGAILAMARGVGEVAPLMLVGALPVAPDLPLDSEFPYFHGSRSFMHLGYQIYWLGFQSQNSEASKPLVFTCTLLLILIVISLNLSAILLRARLRSRFHGNQF